MYPEVAIAPLTSKQRAHLKSLAHHLKPIVQIGKEGLTDASVQSLNDAFRNRELLKLKVQEAAPMSAAATAEALAGRIPEAHVVQTIGRTLVLYRPHPESPEIRLPEVDTGG